MWSIYIWHFHHFEGFCVYQHLLQRALNTFCQDSYGAFLSALYFVSRVWLYQAGSYYFLTNSFL